jgi:hypothetical protein
VVLLHARDPFPPIGFGIGMGHSGEPAGDLPIIRQGNQVGEIFVAK